MNCSVSVGELLEELLLLRQAVEVSPQWQEDAATLHFKSKLLKRGLLFPRIC